VATEVLIRKEHHATGPGKRPFERSFSVRRSTHDSAVLTNERFEAGGRIDVRDRRNVFGIENFAELIPGIFDLVNGRHVGHRAAGGHIREHHWDTLTTALGELFGAVGQDVGRFGHEVHAAEHDVTASAALGGILAEPVTVPTKVGEGDHFVLLIVV